VRKFALGVRAALALRASQRSRRPLLGRFAPGGRHDFG
jgi:hypothetical protein